MSLWFWICKRGSQNNWPLHRTVARLPDTKIPSSRTADAQCWFLSISPEFHKSTAALSTLATKCYTSIGQINIPCRFLCKSWHQPQVHVVWCVASINPADWAWREIRTNQSKSKTNSDGALAQLTSQWQEIAPQNPVFMPQLAKLNPRKKAVAESAIIIDWGFPKSWCCTAGDDGAWAQRFKSKNGQEVQLPFKWIPQEKECHPRFVSLLCLPAAMQYHSFQWSNLNLWLDYIIACSWSMLKICTQSIWNKNTFDLVMQQTTKIEVAKKLSLFLWNIHT